MWPQFLGKLGGLIRGRLLYCYERQITQFLDPLAHLLDHISNGVMSCHQLKMITQKQRSLYMPHATTFYTT